MHTMRLRRGTALIRQYSLGGRKNQLIVSARRPREAPCPLASSAPPGRCFSAWACSCWAPGLQSTLLGVRATIEGFPTLVTGLIMSCYYVGYLLGTLIAPRLLRQVGHIRVFAALAAVASVAILVQGCFVHPWTWGAMRLISGLCFAGIYVVAESWLNDRASRANRGRLFAVYMLVLYGGLGSAQFLLVLSDPRTPIPSCWCRC